jgi:hypothetical protein
MLRYQKLVKVSASILPKWFGRQESPRTGVAQHG